MSTKPVLQHVEIEWQGYVIEVSGQYEPGDPGVWTYSNGDPGYPPTPSNFYIEGIELIKGELLDFVSEIENKAKKSKYCDLIETFENLTIEKIEEE